MCLLYSHVSALILGQVLKVEAVRWFEFSLYDNRTAMHYISEVGIVSNCPHCCEKVKSNLIFLHCRKNTNIEIVRKYDA
jgi:hypothetical protein